MKILVNGVERDCEESTLAELVATITSAQSGIAVAVNDVVIPRHQWPTVAMEDGARIEVVTAVQGG